MLPILLTGTAVLFTYLVMTVNARPVGLDGSVVGFSGVNTHVFALTGYNGLLYAATELLGYVTLAVAAVFPVMGFCQLIRGKSLKAVDRNIIITGAYFALVAGLYVFFDAVPFNYRPVFLGGGLEASYPSSHTMLACCVFGAAFLRAGDHLRDGLAKAVRWISAAVMVFMPLARLLSGVHWLTDILGAIFISAAMISWYIFAVDRLGDGTRHADPVSRD